MPEPPMPLPDLTLDPKTGVLSGTLTKAGCFNFRVTATDRNGELGTRDYTVCICGNLALVPPLPALPPATFGVPIVWTNCFPSLVNL